jgi:hypothetical protein
VVSILELKRNVILCNIHVYSNLFERNEYGAADTIIYSVTKRANGYNVTLRRVRAITLAVAKQYVLHVVSVFVFLVIQLALRMRHIFMWPLPLYSIIPYYLINGTVFQKKLLKVKCLF